jgi:hypothetical protein
MRLTVPASLHGAPVRPGAARIRYVPVHCIHRQASIHRGNRSDPPPGVAGALLCGGCDVRGQGEAITRSP